MLLQSSSSSFLSSNPGILFPTFQIPCRLPKLQTCLRFSPLKTRASLDEKDPNSQAASLLFQNDEQNKQLNQEVEESVRVLKNAAKTRKVPAAEIMAAFSTIERAKVDPSKFLETLGGTKSPGRTWMLVFTAEKGLGRGRYFPITAIQRFDAAAKRIENGVYLGPLGFLTFEGPFSWKNRILAFVFERLRIKIGPFDPFDIRIKGKDEREPSNKGKDPFFIWFYIDEEIAVARGRSGGTAYWVRCRRVGYS
ncbi:putative glutathione S-transferase-like [Capsicum annuum]|uniref:Uncharacterized protein n=1 Tax=Capsicum annuum TaxID=4072 RepID=A0A2G2ZC07_CAPAN|nr:uncharacterized protein LOC107855429 isoform X1 [Capsicum annuum]KAF3650350.1 putative glutathione S-transferase-like [Capsicum annuum]KAF3678056.1 putative glutathione S-transferase-like [Capsicum annuum]PHT79536.1 hypothetical protein T459_17588 [Capsicum annuum]